MMYEAEENLREFFRERMHLGDNLAWDFVSLLSDLMNEKLKDLEDKINKTGEWDPDY